MLADGLVGSEILTKKLLQNASVKDELLRHARAGHLKVVDWVV